MLTDEAILRAIPHAFAGVDLPWLGPREQGKVRDIYRLDGRVDGQRVLITTDRQSAFDRMVGLIPYKGQVLNQLSQFWFERTADIVGNHLLSVPDPNIMVVREAQPVMVEVVVRAYLTGVTTTSIWPPYERGERVIYGYRFPDGLRKNDPLPQPIITPTTKAQFGQHDEPLTNQQVVERGLMDAESYARLCDVALRLFARGQQIAREGGLILVDTKYEFGRVGDEIILIDEVHTPDSSRYWVAKTLEERLARGKEPDNLDKEFLRLWFRRHGYAGEGGPPPLPPEVVARLSRYYLMAYEAVTRELFVPGDQPAAARVERALRQCFAPPDAQGAAPAHPTGPIS